MAPRLYTIQTATHSQQTPAPLLATRKGQYPSLPNQLAARATPRNTTPLLHLSLSDWHTLNPNANLTSATLLPSLKSLPTGPPSAASLCANHNAILILGPRAPSTQELITETPGKLMSVACTGPSKRAVVTPAEVAATHAALVTHFVVSPSDHPPLHATPSRGVSARHAARCEKLLAAFLSTPVPPASTLASIGGGDAPAARAALAAAAASHPVAGFSIDGLYAGEAPHTRDSCVRAVVDALPEEGFRVLAGGPGAPWDVLRAVRAGVDVVAGDFPFEMAASGRATNLAEGGAVNVRERRWETCREVLVEGCSCFVCQEGFSRGYVRHLFEVHEMMGVSLVAAHNLWDYLTWFEQLREAISIGKFEEFVDEFERGRERVRVGGTVGD